MPKMYDFHWSNAKYMNPSRATIPLIRPHQCDSGGGRIRGVLLYYDGIYMRNKIGLSILLLAHFRKVGGGVGLFTEKLFSY